MAKLQNKPEQKYGSSPIAGNDKRTQAEKDKARAAEKHAEKKDASGKPSDKSGSCN